jgi:hypothetical protein
MGEKDRKDVVGDCFDDFDWEEFEAFLNGATFVAAEAISPDAAHTTEAAPTSGQHNAPATVHEQGVLEEIGTPTDVNHVDLLSPSLLPTLTLPLSHAGAPGHVPEAQNVYDEATTDGEALRPIHVLVQEEEEEQERQQPGPGGPLVGGQIVPQDVEIDEELQEDLPVIHLEAQDFSLAILPSEDDMRFDVDRLLADDDEERENQPPQDNLVQPRPLNQQQVPDNCTKDETCPIPAHKTQGMFCDYHPNPLEPFFPQILVTLVTLYCGVVGNINGLAVMCCLFCGLKGLSHYEAISHIKYQHGGLLGNPTSLPDLKQRLKNILSWRSTECKKFPISNVCRICRIQTGGVLGTLIHSCLHPSIDSQLYVCPFLLLCITSY